MCGIVGYTGIRPASQLLLGGLKALEYRGYDSAGIAQSMRDGQLHITKVVGDIAQLEKELGNTVFNSVCGIGHTRWATHGAATLENAHPHVDTLRSFACVHNGIIENADTLRSTVETAGITCISQTDSELIPHLLALAFEHHGEVELAVLSVFAQLKGSFAVAIVSVHEPETIYFMRSHSPLLIGKALHGLYLVSDQAACDESVTEFCFIPDGGVGVLRNASIEWLSEQRASFQKRVGSSVTTDKTGFEHFMLKEIYEQEIAIARTIRELSSSSRSFLLNAFGLERFSEKLPSHIHIIAAGTSAHAGMIGRFFFEEITKVPVSVHLASEFNYAPFFPDYNAWYLFVSQSGETADTLESLRRVKEFGLQTIAVTNVHTSTLARSADGLLPMHAGVEVAVASTKAFSTQLACLYWLAHFLVKSEVAAESLLLEAGHQLITSLKKDEDAVFHVSRRLQHASYVLFLGRHITYPLAAEAALKLKEISYIISAAYPSGELKHGTIALITHGVPVLAFAPADRLLYTKFVSNIQETKARGAYIIGFGLEEQSEFKRLSDVYFSFKRPDDELLVPLIMTGVAQLIAYTVTTHLNLPVDKPRNLAKSVTVE